MSRESHCEHDIAEQETAVAEHLCPLCLQDKLKEANKGAQRNAHINQSLVTQLQAAEAKLEAVRGLVRSWKEGEFNLPDYTRGKRDGRHECAAELEALREKIK